MNVDNILAALNDEGVDFVLIGGMNFLLQHLPELTFDVDVWVRDDPGNLERLNRALQHLEAAWGPTEESWAPVPADAGWLGRQMVYCLTTREGALDIFRCVRGLEDRFEVCRERSKRCQTASGVGFLGLSDEDMLTCQEALPEPEQKLTRVAWLRKAIAQRQGGASHG